MKTKILFCGLIAAFLLGPRAHADVVTFIGTTGFVSTRSTPRTFQVQGFNPGLGTLTGVALTYSAEVMQIGAVENTGATAPMSYTWSGSANLSLAKTSGGPAIFATPTGNFSYSQGGVITDPFDGVDDWGGLSGRTLTIQDTTWQAPASFADLDLASYLSAGPLNFWALATASNSLNVSPGWDLSGGVTSKAMTTLKIDYTYTQIPEPATYAAWLGLTVLGIAAWRRRTSLPA